MPSFNVFLTLPMAIGLLTLSTAATVAYSQSSVDATAYAPASVKTAVNADKTRYLKSLEELVSIESGSRDLEGLARAAAWVGQRLQSAGMSVETLAMKAPENHLLLKGATLGSAVYGKLQGNGTKKILLIAHMDTVYPKGMLAKQPYRVEGNRAYGLAIADDKSGVALIIHTVELLQKMGFKNYAEIGVLINADEEIGSPGSGPLITKLGGEYDAVFSYEGGGGSKDWVRLATSSIAIATLNVTGRASHAGAAPEAGRNALYEMAHQVLKSKDLGDKSKGLTINWTVAKSGETRNVIPAEASAIADIRASANTDLDQMEAALQASIKERLIADTKVELGFLRSRPAFVANDVSRTLAKHAVSVFKEINLPLEIRDTPTGGGTDAAFAGLKPKGGVLESFGLRGHGAHSNDDEYIYIDSIEPRLYLSTRMVIDVGSGAVRW